MGEGVILTSLDLVKLFDKQSLIDACNSLYQAKVNPKFYRVWYNLNAKTELEVRTGSGVSARLAGGWQDQLLARGEEGPRWPAP